MHFFLALFLLHAGSCRGDTTPEPLSCRVRFKKIVRVNIGDDASFGVRFYVDSYYASNYWGADFAWVVNGNEVCRSQQGSCVGHDKSNFQLNVTESSSAREGNYKHYLVELSISRTDPSDYGIHSLQKIRRSQSTPCTIFNFYVAQGSHCTSFLMHHNNDKLKLSCSWVTQVIEDKVELVTENQTLQLYENNEFVTDTTMFRNLASDMSALIALRDVFNKNQTPDACLISNVLFDYENRCTFQVFLSPSVSEIDEYRRKVLFTCCSNLETVPYLWWYTGNSNFTAIDTSGFQFQADMDIFTQDNYGDGDRRSIVLICGAKKNDTLISYGIGKIIFNLTHYRSVSLSTKIEQSARTASTVSNGKTKCLNSFEITITANPQDYERTPYSTDNGPSDLDPSLPPWLDSGILITIILALVISFVLNIVMCVNQYFKIITCRNSRSSPIGGRERGNKREVNRTTNCKNVQEARESTSMSAQEARVAPRENASQEQQATNQTEHLSDNRIEKQTVKRIVEQHGMNDSFSRES